MASPTRQSNQRTSFREIALLVSGDSAKAQHALEAAHNAAASKLLEYPATERDYELLVFTHVLAELGKSLKEPEARRPQGIRQITGNSRLSPEQLRVAILDLPFQERAVFALRSEANLSRADVAQVLGIAQETVRSCEAWALERLAAWLRAQRASR